MWTALKNRVLYWLLAKVFKDGFKQIEKINWMTKVLEILYKQIPKTIWPTFVDSVIDMMKDAINEAETSKGWK